MADVLIVYASKHGQTAKIAARIAKGIEEGGATPHVHDVHSHETVHAAEYDGVIVGASIHTGHHQREIVDWVKHRNTTLTMRPSAFFSVCLTAADDTDEAREASQSYIDEFLDETGWTPGHAETFAGALQYLEYDFMTRLVMRLISKHEHHPTDTSRDYDFTDWDAVERFGREFAQSLEARATATRTGGA